MPAWMMKRNPGIKKAPHTTPREMYGFGYRGYSRGTKKGTVICDIRYAISDFRFGEAVSGNLLFCAMHDPVMKLLYGLSAQYNPHRG